MAAKDYTQQNSAGYLRLLSLQCRRRGALGVVMGVEPTDGEEARLSPDTTTERALHLTTLRRLA